MNGPLGSALVADGLGFVLNNEMDDFRHRSGCCQSVRSHRRRCQRGGHRRSGAADRSIASTLIFKDGQFRYGLGTPGGSTIITQIFWMVLDLVDYGSDLEQAVSAPRVHEQWLPDRVVVERLGFDAPTINALQAMGQQIEWREAWGNAQAIGVLPNGKRTAASDPRGEGAARAY